MKFNFISFLNPFAHHGGGEVVTQRIIETGRARGHEFSFVTQNDAQRNYNPTADLNFFWDVFNCPEQNNSFALHDILALTKEAPYIVGQNGYEDICLLGTVPCEGNTNGQSCLVPLQHQTFGVGGVGRPRPPACVAQQRSALWQNSRLSIFVSEHHKALHEKIIGNIPNSWIMSPPLPALDAYVTMNLPRDIPYLCYGGNLEYKGFFNIMERFPHEPVVFIGGGDDSLLRKYNYGVFAGKVPQERMPEILNRTKTFIHLPRWAEPYGMTTLQAYLCGCELILNEASDVVKGRSEAEIRAAAIRSASCEEFWLKVEGLLSPRHTPITRTETSIEAPQTSLPPVPTADIVEPTEPLKRIVINLTEADRPANVEDHPERRRKPKEYTPPFVSIIIPSGPTEISTTDRIASALAQNYPFFEVLVIDEDGFEWLDRISAQYEKSSQVIRFLHKPKSSCGDTKNVAVASSKGSFCLFLEHNELLDPMTLSVATSKIKRNENITLITFSFTSELPPPLSIANIALDWKHPQSFLFAKSLWEDIGGFYEGLPVPHEGWAFVIAALRNDVDTCQIRKPLVIGQPKKTSANDAAMVRTLFPDLFSIQTILTSHEIIRAEGEHLVENIRQQRKTFPSLVMPATWLGLLYEGKGDPLSAAKSYVESVAQSGALNWQAMIRLTVVCEVLAQSAADPAIAAEQRAAGNEFLLVAEELMNNRAQILAPDWPKPAPRLPEVSSTVISSSESR